MIIPVPKSICDFFNLRYDTKLSKSAIVNKFYTYIRETQLRNKYNKLLVHLDQPLKNIFNLHNTTMLDTSSLIQEINKIYKKNNIVEETEYELLEKLEKVREQKKINEFETQRNYVIHQFIQNSNYQFTAKQAANLIFYITEKEYHPIVNYLLPDDKNLLNALQLINNFMTEKKIRFEDAYEVIRDYLFSIDFMNLL
jgi:hypothetical protein